MAYSCWAQWTAVGWHTLGHLSIWLQHNLVWNWYKAWPSGIIPMLAHGNHTWSTLAITAVLGWWLRWNQNKFMDCSLLGPHVLSSSVWTYGGCELPWLAFVSFCKPLLPLLHPTSQCGFCWLTTCGPYINSFFAWVLQWQNSEWNSGCEKRNNIIQQACLCCLCWVPAGPTQWWSRALKKVTVWLALKDK